MSVGTCVSIYGADGKPTVLKSGHWFCYECNKLRKTIFYPQTGTIEHPCERCGSTVVFRLE